MISNINNQSTPNFHAIRLSAEEAKKAEKHIENLVNLSTAPLESITNSGKKASQNALFNIFDKHLQEEAKIKTRSVCKYKEVLSEIYLMFSELLNDTKNNMNLEQLIKNLNEFKPSKNTVKSEYNHYSLDENIINATFPTTKNEFITEDSLPKPKSATETEKDRQKFEKALQEAKLSDIIEQRLQKRAKGATYSDIAQEENVNISTVERSVKKGILKLQKQNNNFPQNYSEKIKQFASLLGCSEEKAEKAVLRHPDILSKSFETIKQKIKKTSELLGCKEEDFTTAGLKQPALFYLKPENIMNHIKTLAKILGCDEKKLINVTLRRYPAIFFLNPETLITNIKKSAENIGCTEKEFIKAGLTEPTVLYIKPETIMQNIQETISMLECSREDFVKIALKHPVLLYSKATILKRNIERNAELLEVSVPNIIKLGLKTGSLFYQKPETIKRNAQESAKMLETTEKEFIRMAVIHPTLFLLNPKTLRSNVEGIARILGTSVGEYVERMSCRPSIFTQKPETLKKKMQISNYFQKVKGEEPENIVNQNSNASMYSVILAYLIQQLKLPELQEFVRRKRNFNLETFLKVNPNRHFSFKIPADKEAADFVKYVEETSKNTIDKNIFEFKIIKPKKLNNKRMS